jgi:predicted Zn-dependent protease
MAKPGRNDPCRCGSGKKYKRCCLATDEEAERALAPAPTPRHKSPTHAEIAESLAAAYYGPDEAEDELTSASNAAVDLVHAGKLDEAELAARDLIERFPDVHDGWDRLGMVYEARGDQNRRLTAIAKSSTSFAPTRTSTIPTSRPSSTSSSPDSIPPPQPDRLPSAHAQ